MQRLRPLTMLLAIYFDNQPNRQTAEIGKVRPERELTAKAVAMHRFAS